MDQGLPIMDGLTVLGWFKEKCIAKKVKQIPVLMLSAYDREFFKAGVLEEKGVTQYLRKPATQDDLIKFFTEIFAYASQSV
jgi:CheY-like chemotaxis protein